MEMFFGLLISFICGMIFGFATDSVISNKGYDENWFWWGFFFGWIALVVALAKPQKERYTRSPEVSAAYYDNKLMKNNGWICAKCQKTNPHYTGTCSCGNTKNNNEQTKLEIEKRKLETDKIEAIKKYKELFESGVITQEEYEAKKNQLLSELF